MANTIKEFYQEFMEAVKEEANNTGTSSEKQLTNFVLEYIIEDGAAVNPDQVDCINTQAPRPTENGFFKVTAFDFSEESGVLDLFTTYYVESDTIVDLKKSQMDKAHNWAARFFYASIENDLLYNRTLIEDPDMAELIYTIKSQCLNRNISQIRIFIITNGLVKEEFDTPRFMDVNGQAIDLEETIWDIDAIYKSDCAAQNEGSIDIDLETIYGHALPCLEVEESSNVKSYLAVMPAIILAKVYKTYGARLLNQNVRTYLGGKVKVNKGMSETIRKQPGMFFAYNNGISSTSTSVITRQIEGRTVITNIKNWQIVNGGQTTNTIYNSFKNKVPLEGVSLSLKISEIKIENDVDKNQSISDIARFANSQTQIKESDLSSNQEYMIRLDSISQSEWAPVSSKRKNTQWFFERMRGQYDMSKGAPRSAKARKFQAEHPKNQVFAKVDIAKTEMAWNGMPYSSSLGGEQCFNKFWKECIQKNQYTVDDDYFHRLVAKFIIIETIRDEFKRREDMKGYGNIVCNYVLAVIADKAQGRLDLDYIWNHQEVNSLMLPFIVESMEKVYNYILKVSGDGTNVSVAAKRLDFWNAIKLRVGDLALNPSLFEVNQKVELTDSEKQKLIEFNLIDKETWKGLSAWGKENKKLSLLERKKIDHVYTDLVNGKDVAFSMASDIMRLLEKATDMGFQG